MKTLFYRKAVLWFLMLFSASMVSLQAQDVSRYAIDDAVISQIYPDSVIDQSQVGNNILAYRERKDESLLRVMSYIKFDISAAAGKTVEAASFSFRGAVRGEAEEFANDFKLQLRGVTGQWNGAEVTWNTRPTTLGNVLGESFLSTNSARKDFVNEGARLIDFINEEIRKGSKIISFEIRSSGKDSTALSWLGGMMNGNWGPVLNFTLAPQKTGYAIDDAVISQLYPDSVIDQSQIGNNILAYRVREGENLYRVMSYIKFDISGASGKMLETANLSFRGALRAEAAEFENEFKLQLRGVTGDWNGQTVTWNSRPTTGGNVLAESFLTTVSARKDFINTGTRLIDFINEEIRKGKSTISLEIRSSGMDSTELSWIGGMLNGNWGPILDFTFTPESSGYAIDDAVISQIHPDSVIDQSQVGNNILAYRERMEAGLQRVMSYIKFDISAAQGRTLESIKLSFRGALRSEAEEFANDFQLQLRGVSGEWNGQSVTWNNRPTTGGNVLAESFLTTNSARKDFISQGTRLLDFVNEEIRKGKKIVSFEIRSAGKDSTALSWLGGMMNGNFGPILSFAVSSDASGYPFQDAIISQIYADSVIDQSKVGNNILAYRERHDNQLKRVMSYIKFDLRGTEGKTVEAARVSFRGALRNEAAEFENDFKVQLRGVTGEWEDNSITWNTRPTTPGAVLAEAALNTSSLRKDFINDGSRLVDFINEEIRKGKTSVSFEIRSAGRDSTDQMWIGGVLNGNFAPILDFSTPNLFGVSNDTLMAVQDTYVELANPAQNFNGDNKLLFRNQGDNHKEAWIKFDISNVKPGFGTVSMIVDGGLMIPEDVTTNLNQRIDLRRAANDWDETTLSWDNRPEVGGTLVNNFRINGDTTLVMTGMFLTKYLADSLSAGKQYISFVIRGRDGRAWDAFIASKDSIPARLAFDYTDDKQFVVEDVLVKEAEPDENFNTITSMDIRKATAEQDSKEALLKFSLANARSGFETAILNVRGDQQGATAADPREDFFIQVIGLQNAWAEDTTTWNNKPATVGNVLAEYNIRESKYHEIRSPALTEYIRNARRSGQEFVSLLVRGRDETPGHNAWISDKGWQPAFLNLDHRKLVANPIFQTNPGEYFPSVVVKIITPTEGAAIYYTLDGSTPSSASSLYVHADGITLTSSAIVRAIAVKDGFADSDVAEASYSVFPVSEPSFEPSPLVEYIDQVRVLLSAKPEGALIFFSDDGGDPTTPYNPEEGILLTATTTIKARAIENVDEDPYMSPVTEATYVVVNPVDGIGVGPAGVGFKDNTVTGQPENALWLKADALQGVANGTAVTQWPDMSGNENHAYNTWVDGGNNAIPNTAESQKRPPVFVENGINGMPMLRFGTRTGENNDLSSLIIDDADNLDGGASISIFMVMKRNTMLADFAALIQKRDIRGSNTALQAYVLEMNGGADPHTIQFVLARNLFLRSPNQPARLFNDDDFYLLNVELDGNARHATFRSNGEQLARSAYNNIVQSVVAPVILGGFQPMDVAELIIYKSALNRAQRNIVHNYLAVKYNLEISDGDNSLNVYTNQEYKFDLIGIGSETNPDGVTLGRHPSASGAGLELAMSGSFASGDYVLAGHNGAAASDDNANKVWTRRWYAEVIGNPGAAEVGFNYKAAGIPFPANAGDFKLLYDDGEGFEILEAEAVVDEDNETISFVLANLGSGVYTIGLNVPGASVDAPVISPAAGTYTAAVQVSISAAAGTTIFYTTDGSVPTTASNEYTGPFTLEQSATVKAVAASGGLLSTVTEAAYVINIITSLADAFGNSVLIYPNPSDDLLFLELNNEERGEISIRILDTSGRIMHLQQNQKQTEMFKIQLPTHNFKQGIYLIDIQQGDQRSIIRMMKN